jgi:hypothetical protein
MESLKRFEARSTKASISVVETRDTTDPALITQMLIPLLEAIGSSVDLPRLRKRVRDDVNIQDAEFPWRRLPFWLVLRVATQRQLSLALGDLRGRVCYKFLICIVLAQLLEDCAGQLAPESTVMLKAKLCRRLAKLEMDKNRADSSPVIYKLLFDSTGPLLKDIIERATQQVESAWANFKRAILRPIPSLPPRADEQALYLSLQNSGEYLSNRLILSRPPRRDSASRHLPPLGDGTMEQVTKFTDRYFSLARLERRIQKERNKTPRRVADCQARCLELARLIVDLFDVVGDAYESNPEQMSIFILCLFDLWVQMDECAFRACPLLGDYAPIFSPGLLDVLHLPTLSSMQLLQDIQNHLWNRRNKCLFSHKTIFSKLDKDSFAVRYLEQSTQLHDLGEKIERDSARSRKKKESEWKKACETYDDLSEKISSGTCVCSFNRDGSRNVKGCTKCWHWRTRRKMKIDTHEDFLPEDVAQKAAVLFELGIPTFLAAYRNATFRIFSDLGHPSKPETSSPPAMLLKDYSQLTRYKNSTLDGVSLASAKKSFLQTHYKTVKMKAGLSDVLLPLALDFAYFDIKSGLWLKDLDRELTFQHLCGVHVPRSLQTSVFPSSMHPPPSIDGPSSYEIVASQTKCPSEISVHEFMSYQRLLSGKKRRWLTMLVELGASNLNFSAEDTMHVFNQLAVQAGPAQINIDPLRDAHLVFRDLSFCQRLTDRIDNRLRNITTNWRETHCMEMLITLSLRLFNLTSGLYRQTAERLLRVARDSTLQWIAKLRDEVRNAAEADAAERAARYGIWAALLCRRTFTTLADSGSRMNGDDLCSFVRASLALQENLVGDFTKLPLNLKNMLVRDMKMAYQIRRLIEQSIESHPDSLGAAISKTWSDPGNSTGRTYSSWQFLSSPNKRWVVSVITSKANKYIVSQVAHYNFIEGHLLLDGKPLGRLPLDIRESEDVTELFGNQHLLTFPSSLSGMTHVLATRMHDNEVHFGLRGKNVIIQALHQGSLLEYVPRRVFIDNDKFDLPSGLIENCVHWLNISTGRVEIRRKPVIWRTRPSDWSLDVSRRRAQRKMVFLVDPHSDLCKRVAEIFRHFEDPQRLTVFQPTRGVLSVEIRHLELSFFVNRTGLLECRELHAEIDPNQDAGTLYGFQSKIVLRDVVDPEQRSIITALGQVSYKLDGMHVAVRASSTSEYGRFGIDAVLGRLSCPPEPRLLYSKAQFHAFTSFVLPDPLTGRTGTEEALYTLRSGCCQPWTPVGDGPTSILRVIKSLSPGREYYPRDKRRLQTIVWDELLPVSIQHDSYETVVQNILAKSDRLRAFTVQHDKAIDIDIEFPSHLRRRGEIHRLLYERNISDPEELTTKEGTVYKPRDRQASLPQATNVYQIVRLILKQPFSIHMKRKLPAILQKWNLIGGFHYSSDAGSISKSLVDLTENDISEHWGSLVNFCRHTNPDDQYRLIFRLCLLSFGTKPDVDAIQSLAAFGCLDELKSVEPPLGASFAGFKLNAAPTLESLLTFIAADYPDLKPDIRKNKTQQDLLRERHRALCEVEGRKLADFLVRQWPSSEPSAEEFESKIINVELAMKRILPEWQRLYHNLGLSQYVSQVQEILVHHKSADAMPVPRAWNKKPKVFCWPDRGTIIPSLSGDLLVKTAPLHCGYSLPTQELLLRTDLSQGLQSPNERIRVSPKSRPSKEIIELGKILGSFAKSPDAVRQQYGDDLKQSLHALENLSSQPKLQDVPPNINFVSEEIEKARITLNSEFEHLQNAFSAVDDRFQWLKLGNLWPCTTPMTILELLPSSSDHRFGKNMRESLVSYGVLATNLQRLLRIRHAQLKGDEHKRLEEWRNTGHENWKPLDFPDWLLLEIENDLLIRPEQVDVAHAIISPASGSNSVLQMNMGKGKYTIN